MRLSREKIPFKAFEFGFGERKLTLELPETRVMRIVRGRPCPAITDVVTEVKKALRNPIGSPPLGDIVKPGEKVGIVVSDATRPWARSDLFLPALLDELNANGIPDRDIFIVIGLGAHRRHTAEEDTLTCGRDVRGRIHVFPHDCRNGNELAFVGRTSRGVDTFINKRLHEADRMILTGGIVYHYMAGFGGGRKAVMPGIGGFSSIQANHFLFMNKEAGKGINPGCASGSLADNDMHLDMCEMAEMVKPDFILNTVPAPKGGVARFVAGHWYKAWEEGTKLVEELYGVPLEEKADIVIASAGGFPRDINLWQGTKAIVNASMACKPGGAIVCILECREVREPKEFFGWFQYKDIRELEMAIRRCYTPDNAIKSYLGFPAYMCVDIAKKFRLIIVTKPENVNAINGIGMTAVDGLGQAYRIARDGLGKKEFRIAVMPAAADTVPIVRNGYGRFPNCKSHALTP